MPTSFKEQLYADLPVPPKSQTIRVLDLEPARNDDAPLLGRLRVVSLQDRPIFTTLSYVWGESTSPSPTLSVATVTPSHSNINIDITPNCLHALHCIRKQVGGATLTIWIDAVCINQQDTVEKTDQIPLMREIYSQASTCYVWLGEGSKQSDFAIDRLRWRARALKRLPLGYVSIPPLSAEKRAIEVKAFKERSREDIFVRLWSRSLQKLRKRNRTTYRNKEKRVRTRNTQGDELKWLQQLLQRQWVSRAWTFQELVLSETPIFLCGNSVILWEDMVNAVLLPDASPLMNQALGPWRSLAHLWLNFPRATLGGSGAPDLDLELASTTPHYTSFKKLVSAEFTRGGPGFDSPAAAWAFWIWLALILVHYLLFLPAIVAVAAKFIKLDDAHGPPAAVNLLLILTCIFYPFWSFMLAKHSFQLFQFIAAGKLHTWLPSRDHNHDCADPDDMDYLSRHKLFLTGVWEALQKRDCRNPHDKAFALSGILAAQGVSSAQPDYSRSIKDTYIILLGDLLSWQQISITLILSGRGSQAKDGWPTWLPDWIVPEPNAWLLNPSRLQTLSATSLFTTAFERPTISGDSLIVRAEYLGKITNPFYHFDAIADTADASQLLPALRDLTEWMWSVKELNKTVKELSASYNVPKYAVFAILEGLYPREIEKTYTTSAATREHPQRVRTHTRKRWEAPYDFTDSLDEFLAFEAFWKIVIKVKVSRSSNIDNTNSLNDEITTGNSTSFNNTTPNPISEEEEILAHLQSPPFNIPNTFTLLPWRKQTRHYKAFDYFIRIVNKLASERRCLFIMSLKAPNNMKISSQDIPTTTQTPEPENSYPVVPVPTVTDTEPASSPRGVMAGSGPLEIANNDSIYLIPGVLTPVVLRPQDHEHVNAKPAVLKFIGPALVHGLMRRAGFYIGQPDRIVLR